MTLLGFGSFSAVRQDGLGVVARFCVFLVSSEVVTASANTDASVRTIGGLNTLVITRIFLKFLAREM